MSITVVGYVSEVGIGASDGIGSGDGTNSFVGDGLSVTSGGVVSAALSDGFADVSGEAGDDGLPESALSGELPGVDAPVELAQPVRLTSAAAMMRTTASSVPVHLLFLKVPIMCILLLTLVLFYDRDKAGFRKQPEQLNDRTAVRLTLVRV
jgi:hypothetical protein